MALDFEGLMNNPWFVSGLYGLAATPGSTGLAPVAQGMTKGYEHLARLNEVKEKKEASALYKQQVEAQMMKVNMLKRQQQVQEDFAKEVASRMDPSMGPTLTPEQIMHMGLARGAVDPMEYAKAMKGDAKANRPFTVAPQGALVSPEGKELYRNPAMRGSGVIRDPGTGLPMVPGEDGTYEPLPGFSPRPARVAGRSGAADPSGKLPTGYRWTDPNDKSKGAERIPGTEKVAAIKDEGTASLDVSVKLIDDMQNLVKLGEQKFTGVTGLKGKVTRNLEAAHGLINPSAPAPALTFRAKKELLLSQIRKMFDGGALSNADKERMDAAVGGDIFSTPMTTLESLETLKSTIQGIKAEKTRKTPTQKQEASGGLTAEEQQELDALRKRFGK